MRFVRCEDVALVFKSRYLGEHLKSELARVVDQNAASESQEGYDLSMSASFSLEKVKSFSDWPVLLSLQAVADIRKARQRSLKEAKKIVEKIRYVHMYVIK
jgi:hypothetical protein